MNFQLRALRKKAKMSQTELAEKIDVNLRTIGAWERGETIPNAEQIWNCSEALGTDPDTLLGWPESAPAYSDPRQAELNRCWESSTPQRQDALLMTARDFAASSREGAERDELREEAV